MCCCHFHLTVVHRSSKCYLCGHLNLMTTETILKELTIDTALLREAASVFRAINHPVRQEMLRMMHQNSRLTVTAIYKHLNIEQSVASQHLGILRAAGIVKTERQLKFIFYSVDYTRLELIHVLAKELIG